MRPYSSKYRVNTVMNVYFASGFHQSICRFFHIHDLHPIQTVWCYSPDFGRPILKVSAHQPKVLHRRERVEPSTLSQNMRLRMNVSFK